MCLNKTYHFVFSFPEIEVVSEITEEELKAAEGDKPVLTAGITVAYTKPAKTTEVISAVQLA